MARITLPDGSIIEAADGITAKQLAEQIGAGLAKAAVAARINDQLVDLSTPIKADAKLQIITPKDAEGLDVMRHSCAHVMAEAICGFWPNAKLVYGPTVEDGFYYDIDLDEPIRPGDFERIEEKMSEIVKADRPFVRKEMTRAEALEKLCRRQIQDRQRQSRHRRRHQLLFLRRWLRGPLPRARTSPAPAKSAHSRLCRLPAHTGTATPPRRCSRGFTAPAWRTQKELDEYLTRLEEAKRRDHRVIGQATGPVQLQRRRARLCLYAPQGNDYLELDSRFLAGVHSKYNYEEIKTPIILNKELWHRSGHWDHYKENMYFTRFDDADYAIKPMNCPGGCLVYKTRKHSYREFPLRVAEFGLVHRHEASGVMHGLFRVRQFTQDDAHIFCTPDQIESEIIGVIELTFEIYRAFGFEDFHVELSTKPENHIGSDEIWEIATNALKEALRHKDIDYKINEGDGAFYGPKIDFHIQDCLKRSWQLGTIQLDFSMPQRFELVYTDKDNTEKTPVMIHRAVLGSFERFIGILIEHYAGEMPVVARARAGQNPAHKRKDQRLRQGGREQAQGAATCDAHAICPMRKSGPKSPKRTRDKLPYMLVVGPKESQSDSVNVRIRGQEQTKTLKTDEFIAIAAQKIADKQIGLAL